MADKPRLDRQSMCDRLAVEFRDGWIVNLGVGIPTLCSNYVDERRTIINQSENGVIGYGPLAQPGAEDKHLVNAGGQSVTALPGMAIVHHADAILTDQRRIRRRHGYGLLPGCRKRRLC